MESEALAVAAKHFEDPAVGLVHHTPEGREAHSLGAKLEQMFLNTAHAKIYVVINSIGKASCVIGKSTLFRKRYMEECGGLGSFACYMAEDNLIGIALMEKGYQHRLSVRTAIQPLTKSTVYEYLMRRIRWTRIRAYTMPVVTMIEPFTESIVSGLLGAWTLQKLFGVFFWNTFLCHLVFWFLCDVGLSAGLQQQLPEEFGNFFVVWVLRELSAVPIYLFSLVDNKVNWRDRHYRLKLGGYVELISSDSLEIKRSGRKTDKKKSVTTRSRSSSVKTS